MIQLYQYEPALGLPNASPFCLKLETYLRMAEVPYAVAPASLGAIGQAPKGKMPYIRDGDQLLADTSFIIAYLKTRHGDPLDGRKPFLANLIQVPVESPLKQHALQYPRLKAYCERMQRQYFA